MATQLGDGVGACPKGDRRQVYGRRRHGCHPRGASKRRHSEQPKPPSLRTHFTDNHNDVFTYLGNRATSGDTYGIDTPVTAPSGTPMWRTEPKSISFTLPSN